MDDQTTTGAPVDPTEGGVQPQPAEAPVTEPAEPAVATDPSETPEAGGEQPQDGGAEPESDDKLRRYAESQGIALDSPGAIKAAEIAMKAQSEATRNYHKAAELEKATNITADQLPADASPQLQENARVRNLELKMDIQSWKMSNPDKLALESQMVQVLADPTKRAMVQEGYLSLDDVYSMAKGAAPDTTAQAESQGAQRALQTLAQKQQAAVPTGHATTNTPPPAKQFADLSLDEMREKLGTVRG